MEIDLSIREAGKDDIDTIRHLAQTVWPSTYANILSLEQIAYMMDLFYSYASLEAQLKKHRFVLATSGKEAVGFASYSASNLAGIYKLHKLYVLAATQGKGVGRTLVKHILGELEPLRATALELNVNRYNGARVFYEKLGFEIIQEEDVDIGNHFQMNDYVMRLQIS